MADESSGEKSEKPTQTRRDEFRRQGQVAQSREISTAMYLMLSAGTLYFLSRFFFQHFREIFEQSFGLNMVSLVRQGKITDALAFTGKEIVVMLTPVLAAVGVLSVTSSVLQIGLLQVEDALTPDFSRINPIDGFKRIFALRNVAEAIKSSLKLLAIGYVLFLLLRNEIHQFPYLLQYDVAQTLAYIGKVVFKLLMGIGVAMTVIAAADYFFQRWDLEKKMMMTKQQVKEEVKQREGDPMIRARVRRIQREMANKRMMEQVPKADVIITNPTHIAVALQYNEGLSAPKLIAKGADLLAEKIKEIAREHQVPIVENKPLARTIFKTMKIGQVIPRELFVAVAEVLSYVYKLKKKVMR